MINSTSVTQLLVRLNKCPIGYSALSIICDTILPLTQFGVKSDIRNYCIHVCIFPFILIPIILKYELAICSQIKLKIANKIYNALRFPLVDSFYTKQISFLAWINFCFSQIKEIRFSTSPYFLTLMRLLPSICGLQNFLSLVNNLLIKLKNVRPIIAQCLELVPINWVNIITWTFCC